MRPALALLALLLALLAHACATAAPYRQGLAWGSTLPETAAAGRCLRAYQYDDTGLASCLDGVRAGVP